MAYAAVANGGYVVKPHLGRRIEDADGRVLQELETPSRKRLDIDPAYRQAIMDGLVGAANGPGGTSTAVFAGFRIPIAGKTGTAEKGLGRADQSWYAAITYPQDPQYVVVATDEARRLRRRARGADGAADHRRALRREGRGTHDRE